MFWEYALWDMLSIAKCVGRQSMLVDHQEIMGGAINAPIGWFRLFSANRVVVVSLFRR